MDSSPGPSGRRRRKKGKATDDHSPTPGARPSTTGEGALTLSRIFLPQGPPPLKRTRSSTVSTMPGMEYHLLAGKSVTASSGVAVLERDIAIDSNQTGGINEIKYRRRQQVIE